MLKNYGFLGVMLLIVFSVLFGFAANMAGGPETAVAKWLRSMTETMLQFIKLVTYYAPVAFFAIFANLVADYGPQIAGAYGRALAVYYPLCLVYVFTAFPLFARFGGGGRASCCGTSPSRLWCPWAPARRWPLSLPIWRKQGRPASAGASRKW